MRVSNKRAKSKGKKEKAHLDRTASKKKKKKEVLVY